MGTEQNSVIQILIAYIMSDGFYGDIADDIERWFDTSN